MGYACASGHFHNTLDVDGILPLAWLRPPNQHEDFWQAVQQTNVELQSEGLYLTHLFRETDVILQPDWLEHRQLLELGLQKLIVYRPATIDLILTKMAWLMKTICRTSNFYSGRNTLINISWKLRLPGRVCQGCRRFKNCSTARFPK